MGTVCLILVLVFLLGTTVSGQREEGEIVETALVQEEVLVAEGMRTVLGEAGFQNSGINITHVVDELGNRLYSVRIHHQDFTRLSSVQQLELRGQLAEVFGANPGLGSFACQVDFF